MSPNGRLIFDRETYYWGVPDDKGPCIVFDDDNFCIDATSNNDPLIACCLILK